jgi:signal transduction histidine kinase/ligand-binding sensor domain-containing protein
MDSVNKLIAGMFATHPKILIIISLALFFEISTAFAQSQQPFLFQKIDENNGLSNNKVQCIFKDKNGFMWIGTASGLNLMDGSTITVFKNDFNDPHSISSNNITAISSDSSGILWIGTNEGLNFFDPWLRKFSVWPLQKNLPATNDNIIGIATDKKNNLFIAAGSGLCFINQKTKETAHLEIPGNNDEKVLNNNITHIEIDQNGIVWMSTYDGLWSYDENKHQFRHEISSANDADFTPLFTTFIMDHNGTLWIGTWDKGLKEYDPVAKKVTTYKAYTNSPAITSIAEIKQPDGKYLLWLNVNTYRFDLQKNKFISFPVSENFPASFNTVLYSLNKQWMWIGSRDGLYFYNPSKNLIVHHRFENRITDQGVSLLEWKNKIIVSGAGKYFLKAFDHELNETDNFPAPSEYHDISCLSLKYGNAGHLVAGTSEGVADINLNSDEITLQRIPSSTQTSSTINFITTLLKDKTGNWWLFPWRNGIWKADTAFENIHQVFKNFISTYNVPKPLVISDAVQDDAGNIWMGDYDEGVILYNRQTNDFSKPFIKELGLRATITQLIYKDGYCYSFYGSSLFTWNCALRRLRKITLPELSDKPIRSIAFDSIGHLWLATQNGLCSYNPETKSVNHFSTADGLLINNMDGVLYCRSDGRMVFACPDFLSSFQPGKLLESIQKVPDLKFMEMIVDGKPFKADTAGLMRFHIDVSDFIFKWAVTDFNNPLNNRYYYQLQGIDKGWRFAGKKGEIEFANLSSGIYTLLLKGANANGIEASKILKLHFEIEQPFWRTVWFIALLFIAIVAVIYLFYHYRLKQLLELQKLRNKISLDLHDDLGSTLSSISILSGMALKEKKNADASLILSEIKESSISMLEKMDDIVWSINSKNDSLESLFLRIRTFAAKLFEAKEINYKIAIDESIKNVHLQMEYRQHIYLILKEAVNNLVKYSECTEASISVSCYAGLLKVVIKDNGKGFDPATNTYGNGINSMNKRAAAMKSTIELDSKPGSGTSITLLVKIK